MEIQGNETFSLCIDEQQMGENETFTITLQPKETDHYFHPTSDKPVAAYISMRRETPIAYATIPSLPIVLGVVVLTLLLKRQRDQT